MLYKFKSKATSDLIMLEPDGKRILTLIRNDHSSKGILTPAQLPQAIKALEAAIALEEVRIADALLAQKEARSNSDAQTSFREPDTVSLKRRAQPMLEMLRRSLTAQTDVIWGV
jgi:cyclopropane-fatty-acyl-phospholipid synthase